MLNNYACLGRTFQVGEVEMLPLINSIATPTNRADGILYLRILA
jgi:hypothetical protein